MEKEEMKPSSEISPQKGGWWTNTAQWMKKQYFNVTHNIDLNLNNEASQQIWIMGNQYSSNESAKIIYSSLLWFTYRDDLTFDHSDLTSDVGWGCMVRVAQMMMAQAIRLNKGLTYYSDPYTINQIVTHFLTQNGKFSINTIASHAERLYKKKPGQWYSPSEAAYILRQIQNSIPITTSNLKMMVLDNEFQFNTTFAYLSKENKQKNIYISNSSYKKNKADFKFDEKMSIDPGLIIILIRIGMNSPQPELLETIVRILKEESNCIGILGGRPGRAHYLVGTTDKSFLYLDPHCVKQKSELEEFFCPNMFSIAHEKIDTSMGLCFYINDTSELIAIHDRFKADSKKLPFYSYEVGEKPVMFQTTQKDQEFELLGEDD